jgi:rhomboid protease GluP
MSVTPASPPHNESEDVSRFIQQLYLGCPRVIITPAILVINAIVFVFMLFQGVGITGQNLPVYIQYGANLGALTKDDQWWRLFTAIFLHYGILHLAFNMWALWDAGRLTERLFGHKNFAWIYLFAGLFASLASLYWNQDDVASVGASGAVFGIFGALIGYLVRQRHTVPRLLLRQLLKTALFFTGFALFLGFSVPAIDNAAHIGGLISGLLMGMLLAKPLTQSRPAILPAMLAHAGSVVLLVIAITMAPAAYYDYQAQKQAEQSISRFVQEENRLMDEWKVLVKGLQSGNPTSEIDTHQQLNRMLEEWAQLQSQTFIAGNIQEQSRERMALLNEYAGYRMNNIRYLIRYIETGDNRQMTSIRQNTEEIKRVLKLLNQSVGLPD